MGQISLFAFYTGLESVLCVASHDNNFNQVGYEKLGSIFIYESGASDMSEQICRKFGPFV